MLECFDIVLVYFKQEDTDKFDYRPAMVISSDTVALIAKITKHDIRGSQDYRIIDWADAGLNMASTIRLSKLVRVPSNICKKIGHLTQRDIDGISTNIMFTKDSEKTIREEAPQNRVQEIINKLFCEVTANVDRSDDNRYMDLSIYDAHASAMVPDDDGNDAEVLMEFAFDNGIYWPAGEDSSILPEVKNDVIKNLKCTEFTTDLIDLTAEEKDAIIDAAKNRVVDKIMDKVGENYTALVDESVDDNINESEAFEYFCDFEEPEYDPDYNPYNPRHFSN